MVLLPLSKNLGLGAAGRLKFVCQFDQLVSVVWNVGKAVTTDLKISHGCEWKKWEGQEIIFQVLCFFHISFTTTNNFMYVSV